MGWLRTLAVCGSALAISGAAAHAADMPGDSSPFPFPRERSSRVDQLFSGWYLRGDVGYRLQHVGSASDLTHDFTSSSIKDAYVGSAGVGYKVQWFRADLTGDYGWRSIYSGATASGTPTVSAKFDTFTVMLNGYVDLGTWGGFTPYVGAGFGGAQLNASSYETVPKQLSATPSVSRWNVAWAAMAGVSYNLSYNVTLDVGYRHVDMGDATAGPIPNPLTVKKLTGDEFRIGIRYLLD